MRPTANTSAHARTDRLKRIYTLTLTLTLLLALLAAVAVAFVLTRRVVRRV